VQRQAAGAERRGLDVVVGGRRIGDDNFERKVKLQLFVNRRASS
jgi:hypothetical protein